MGNVKQAHVVIEQLHGRVITPGHPPRRATAAYAHSHHQLVVVLDKPCEICGVRHSTLTDPAQNPAGAQYLETHHYPVEWSYADMVDWQKVHLDYPEVVSQETFEAWLDSPRNLKILCDVHHVSSCGIHHVSAGDYIIQRYLKAGAVFFAPDDAATLAKDEAIDNALDTPPGGVTP